MANANENDNINSFIDQLIREKELEGLDEPTLKQIKADLLERVENRINAKILEAIPAEKLPEFEKLLDKGDSADIQHFCQSNVRDLDQLIAQTLIDFRKAYLNI